MSDGVRPDWVIRVVGVAAITLLARRWRNSHVDVAALAALEEAATGNPLIAGNKVTLLYDGPQTMAEMTAAISAARDHINLETYIFDQDELGIRLVLHAKTAVIDNVWATVGSTQYRYPQLPAQP